MIFDEMERQGYPKIFEIFKVLKEKKVVENKAKASSAIKKLEYIPE